MEEKLNERKQVVATLMQNAIVSQPDAENQPNLYRVIVPGAIREENSVKANSEEEAVQKVQTILNVKEQSKIESQERLASRTEEDQGTKNIESKRLSVAGLQERGEPVPVDYPVADEQIEIKPDNATISPSAEVIQ